MKSRTTIAVLSVLVLGFSLGTARSEEASHVFLEIDGMPGFHGLTEVGGADVSQWIKVLAFSDGVSAATALDARRAGKPKASEIVLRKPVDQSAPLFYQAFAQYPTLPDATFHFFGQDSESGETFEFYKVRLIGARVTSVTTHYESGVGLVQEVRLLAPRIQWTYSGQGGETESLFEAF